MGTLEDYNAKLPAIMAIREEDIIYPTAIPIETYIHDAEMLRQWCEPDKEAFLKANFNFKIAEDIPVLIGALREAVSRWTGQRFAKKETGQLWKEKSVELYDLRNALMHHFRYAYRKNEFVLNRVNAIAGSQAYPALIQDLNDLSFVGKNNPDELKAINFDTTQLDKAAKLAQEMGVLFAASTLEGYCSAAKKIRDQAFTLLKNSVDEICDCGQWLFWKDEARKKGYLKPSLRRVRKRKSNGEGNLETVQATAQGKDI